MAWDGYLAALLSARGVAVGGEVLRLCTVGD